VAHYGAFNSLAQTLVKITAPGVPDFYQGTELWDLSLVDPDNRRPVDFQRRRHLLDGLRDEIKSTHDLAAFARSLVDDTADGRVKMYVIRQALHFRRDHAALFADGEYWPLEVAGEFAEHVCAFARVRGDDAAVVVIPRLLARRDAEHGVGEGAWGDTRITVPEAAGRRFRNVFTNERVEAGGEAPAVAAADVFARFPVALLARVA
jgi:(1->4)-alpha-D-glucan 1-alpha-D-glucosylmutase